MLRGIASSTAESSQSLIRCLRRDMTAYYVPTGAMNAQCAQPSVRYDPSMDELHCDYIFWRCCGENVVIWRFRRGCHKIVDAGAHVFLSYRQCCRQCCRQYFLCLPRLSSEPPSVDSGHPPVKFKRHALECTTFMPIAQIQMHKKVVSKSPGIMGKIIYTPK